MIRQQNNQIVCIGMVSYSQSNMRVHKLKCNRKMVVRSRINVLKTFDM